MLCAEDSTAFEDVVPHHDDAGGDEFGDHVVNADDVDEYPHEQLVEPESGDTRPEKEHLRASCLCVRATKDADEAEIVVHEDGDGEGDAGGDEIVESAVLGEDVEQTVVEKEARAADEDEAGDFVESG